MSRLPRLAAALTLALPLAGTLPLTGLSPSGAHAQSVERLRERDQPLEINANDGIEWNRNDTTYIARGNARAASGDVEALAAVLTAHYRDPGGDEEASTETYLLEAWGHATIHSQAGTVHG